MEKLAELAGTNKATTRDEFLHPLIVLSHDDSPLGDSSRFDVSLNLGLSAEEHMSLVQTRRSTKALLKEYEAAEEEHKDASFSKTRGAGDHGSICTADRGDNRSIKRKARRRGRGAEPGAK